jgi:hypothetical protein
VPSSIAEIEKATRGPSISRFSSKKDKKKSKKGKTPTSQENSSHEPVVDDERLAPVETSPADNGGLSSPTILPEESSKGIGQSIFEVEPSGSKQTDTIPEMVEPGESRNSNELSGAGYHALLRASHSSRQSGIENFTHKGQGVKILLRLARGSSL